ncbi:MAG: universal stress protein [Acidimicrobiales bacterium]
MSYENLIVGTDGSETAELAVRHAGSLAHDHGARLVIVTAYEPAGDELAKDDQVSDDIRWMLTDQAQAEERARRGRDIAKEQGAGQIVVQAVAGSPADVILESAADFGADCIIVGSKGLTGAARFVLGSVASSVSHHAPCDVLIVHTTD